MRLDAGPLEGRFVHGIDAGHGPRVRGRSLGGFLEPARLVGHDRLRAGEGAGRGEELAGLADRLDIQNDGTRFRRGTQVVDEVAHAHVEHVAHGYKVRKADPFIDGPIEHRRAERPRLRDESDMPGGWCHGGEAGVQPEARNDDSQAVGAQDPHAVELALLGADGFFQFAARLARLAEPGGKDDDAPHALLTARPYDPRHDRRRRADHGQIDDGGNALDIAVSLDSLHRRVRGMDRIDHTPIVGGNQIVKDRVADAGRCFVGANHGDLPRIEDFVEIADAHSGLGTDSEVHPANKFWRELLLTFSAAPRIAR